VRWLTVATPMLHANKFEDFGSTAFGQQCTKAYALVFLCAPACTDGKDRGSALGTYL
jgi:hypothetical protein